MLTPLCTPRCEDQDLSHHFLGERSLFSVKMAFLAIFSLFMPVSVIEWRLSGWWWKLLLVPPGCNSCHLEEREAKVLEEQAGLHLQVTMRYHSNPPVCTCNHCCCSSITVTIESISLSFRTLLNHQ